MTSNGEFYFNLKQVEGCTHLNILSFAMSLKQMGEIFHGPYRPNCKLNTAS